MAVSAKSEEIGDKVAAEQVAENIAGISRALSAVRETHVSVLENWNGRAARAATEAFARFDAELGRYETMIGRFAKSYSESGDRDAG